MGPRSGERGRGPAHKLGIGGNTWLQWGRALVSAEGQHVVFEHALVGVASMGPRSGERGRTAQQILGQFRTLRFNGAALW